MAYEQAQRQDYFGFHDPEAFRREQKLHEMRCKQQTQYAIAQQLSAMDKDEYGDDMLEDMLETEVNELVHCYEDEANNLRKN